MPDISMCRDGACPSKLTCQRFMATPDMYFQAYTQFNRMGQDKCSAYIPFVPPKPRILKRRKRK